MVSIDFRKLRGTPVWKQLAALAGEDPNDRRIIDELTARTGLDPFRQVHRLVAAFPDDARQAGAFAVLFEGDGFDEKRLLTYARDQAKLRGQRIEQRLRGKRTFWVGRRTGPAVGRVPGSTSLRAGRRGLGREGGRSGRP